MNITSLGIDLAKNVFQLHGVDQHGNAVLRKRLRRHELLGFVIQLPKCTIMMEACGGANYWCRQFKAVGHEVKLISPQYVKPFVKTNKNDRNDAQAITEAGSRPSMYFVSPKTLEQEDIQAIHRVRNRYVMQRTAIANQARGLLAEYGIVIAKGIGHLRKRLPEILEDGENELTPMSRTLFSDLYDELCNLNEKIQAYDQKLEVIFSASADCQRLSTIPGLGRLTTTALVAAVGDITVFRNGRQMAAWLGLVPRQHSSGNRTILQGISKRGDCYLPID